MFSYDFWMLVSRVAFYLFILFSFWRAWERYKEWRNRKNGDALIQAIVEGHITSVEWGVDPSQNPGGLHVPRYCVFEGRGWKFLAQEGSSGMKRAPHGFVPHKIRALMQIPRLFEVLPYVAGILRMATGPDYEVPYGGRSSGSIKRRASKK